MFNSSIYPFYICNYVFKIKTNDNNSCWHQFKAQQVETRTLKLPDDRDDIKEGEGDGELLRVA